MKNLFYKNETTLIIAVFISLLISNSINTENINFSIKIIGITLKVTNPPIIIFIVPIFLLTLLILTLIKKSILSKKANEIPEMTDEEFEKIMKERKTKVILDENFHNQLKKYLPGYNYKIFKENLFTVYCRYLHYVNEDRIDKIKVYTTSDYFKKIQKENDKTKKCEKEGKKKQEAFQLTKAKVLYICETKKYLEVLVDFKYAVNTKKLKGIPSNAQVTFTCPIFVKTNDLCPSCGAKIKDNLFKCIYCHTALNNKKHALIHCPGCGNHINPNSFDFCEYCNTNYSNIQSDWRIKDIKHND